MEKLKSDIKLDLIKYFEEVSFSIDIKAQELLSGVNEQVKLEFNKEEREQLLKLNNDWIERAEKILDSNLKRVNEYIDSLLTKSKNESPNFEKNESKIDKEELKAKI